MITFINYLIEVNLGLVFFYAIYWLLLQNENQFGFKRIYLIGSLCASLLFPAFTIESQSIVLIPSLGEAVPAHWLPEITIYGDGQAAPEKVIASTSYWTWIAYAYLTIAAIILAIFIFRLFEITRLYITARRYAWKKYTVAESADVKGVFSFFQFIFLSPGENLDEQEKLEILRHEEVHIQKLHSFDILLINVIGIVCWFNPVIKSYKKSLVQIHEFEADARSVEGRDVNEYCGLLAKVALQSHGYVLANHFTNSFTLKRINMMKTVRKKIKQWKVVTVSVTALLIFFVVACQDQIADLKVVTDNSSMSLSYPEEVRIELEKARAGFPGIEFYVLELNEEGKRKLNEIIKEMNITALEGRSVMVKQGDDQRNFFIYKKDGQTISWNSLTASENGVFSVVEQSAEPKNGMDEFYKHIATQIKYPAVARSMGIEGRVFVEFVVDTDGTIYDAHPVKGIGGGCDEEAVRVVASSPPWNPGKDKGKAVKQRMVIPIIFQLGNSTKKVELGQAPKDTMEKMMVVAH